MLRCCPATSGSCRAIDDCPTPWLLLLHLQERLAGSLEVLEVQRTAILVAAIAEGKDEEGAGRRDAFCRGGFFQYRVSQTKSSVAAGDTALPQQATAHTAVCSQQRCQLRSGQHSCA